MEKDRYDAFCDAVCAAVPRATAREREEIRRELRDHLEDHALDMRERDWSEEEAQKRAVEAMGDPAEIGKAWNDQLSPFWLWVGRCAKMLTAVLLICALLPTLNTVIAVGRNTWTQISSLDQFRYGYDDALTQWDPDVRVEMGDFELRFYRAGIIPLTDGDRLSYFYPELEGEWYKLKVTAAVYSRNPLYQGPIGMWDGLDSGWKLGGFTSYGGDINHQDLFCPVKKGQESATLSVDNDFGSFTLTLPLEWGDGT